MPESYPEQMVAPDFLLPNVGPGPDPFSISDIETDVTFVVVMFQRDHLCTNCRSQVKMVGERYDAFRARDAEVVSIIPEPKEKVAEWQAAYDLPYPLLADQDTTASDQYEQPVRFGVLGRFSDFLGRMPEIAVVDRRGSEATVAYIHKGRSTFDRPEVADLLAELDALAEP
jgi:peroxiredoxin Q/BCP